MLIILFIILIALNVVFMSFNFLPVQDATFCFDIFYYFYNEYFHHGHIAQWIPSNFYGMTSIYYQLVCLTPMSYLTAFVGEVLRVEDVFLLWKISMILEQMLFVGGLFVLSRFLFKERLVVFFVCLAGIGTTLWWGQVFFNFRLFYLLPLMMFCFFSFFKNNQPFFLWATMLIGLSAILGNSQYFASLWLLIFVVMGVVLTVKYPRAFYSPPPNLPPQGGGNGYLRVLFPLVVVLFVGLYLYLLSHALNGATIVAQGRDPQGTHVLLGSFLNHGGVMSWPKLFKAFLLIVQGEFLTPHPDYLMDMIYIGVLPFVFFLWSIIFVRGAFYYALLAVIFILGGLAMGGDVAKVLYYFPMMSYFRHIGYIYGLIKVLILLCAAFGFQDFLIKQRQRRNIAYVLIVSGLYIFLLMLKLQSFVWWSQILLCSFIGMLVVWWIYSQKATWVRSVWVFGLIFVFSLIIDLACYQRIIFKVGPLFDGGIHDHLTATRVHPWAYQPQRTLNPRGDTDRAQKAIGMVKYTGSEYTAVYAYAQADVCRPMYRTFLRTNDVHRLVSIHQDLPVLAGGCYEPKLRLYAQARPLTLVEENSLWQWLIKDVDDRKDLLKDVLFIREDKVNVLPMPLAKLPSAQIGETKVTEFTTDEMIIDANITRPSGGWLFYADAFYPDWRAQVDGQDVPIHLANGVYKAVELPKGKHTVRFFMGHGHCFYAGIFLALFGLMMGIIYIVWMLKETVKHL